MRSVNFHSAAFLFTALVLMPWGNAFSASAPLVVSVDWLEEHINDSDLVLLHVGPQAEFDSAHIPGARLVSLQDISTPANTLPALQLPPVEQLERTFETLGISDDSRIVVCFGKDSITRATRLVLTLHYFGLGDHTSLLDGGVPAWAAQGKPLTPVVKTPPKGRSLTPKVNEDVVVDLAWIQSRLRQPQIALLDARTPDFYTGESAGNAARPGHIPGAISIPFNTVVNEAGKLKDIGALEALFHDAGIKAGQTVVTYCHIGQQASLLYLVARHLGYDARMYDGSYTEWASQSDLPVEKQP